MIIRVVFEELADCMLTIVLLNTDAMPTSNFQPIRLFDKDFSLRKHAYINILNILPPKNENFQIKISYIFHISAQNIDCGYSLEPPRRGGSNEYPQSMFLEEIRKIMYTPINPSFTK